MTHEHEWFGEEPVQPAGWITQSEKLTCLEQECRVTVCFVCICMCVCIILAESCVVPCLVQNEKHINIIKHTEP